MRKLSLLLIALWLTTAGVCRGDSQDQRSRENAELRKRVEKMEKELAELKAMLIEQAKTLDPLL